MQNKKARLSICFLSFVLALGAPASYGQNNIPKRPNIIFILTDDQRWDAAGFAGNKIIHTPEMNELAADGAYFRNAFVTTPICAASRASFLTGLYERTHRYTFQVDKIRDEYMELSYPKIMRDNGYYTGFFGKLGVSGIDNDKLFDKFEVYDRNNQFEDRRGYYYKTLNGDTVHLTPYTGERVREFIKSAPDDQPFCLSVSFSAPHAHDPAPDQYFWEPEVGDLYSDIVIPGPEFADDQYFNAQPAIVREGINRTRWYWRFDTPEKYQHSMKGYFRMISGVDREIGKIREELRRNNLDKNTIIILMGDNGYFLGERQLAGKWLMYENSIGVPLVVYDPTLASGQKRLEMALNIDVPATMLDFADIEIPEHWQGRSLVPLVRGGTETLNRDTLFFEHLWETKMIPPSEGVRTSEWKYFRYINDKSIEELYNLKADPKEMNNLATHRKYRKVLLNLRKKCDELPGKYGDPLSGLPRDLSVDFKGTNSSGTVLPKYSWTLADEASLQNAYQILVSSSDENIRNNTGDVWNSGRVKTDRTDHIKHEGSDLQPGRAYFWKVRIWDGDNRLTEYTPSVMFTVPKKSK
jgi:alpha-L-rhamnosidase